MKYRVLYPSLIAGEIRKSGEIIELSDKTDKNFIKRLLTIKAIKEIAGDDKKEEAKGEESKTAPKSSTKRTTKKDD